MRKNIIYGLFDPRTDLCYYVGKSSIGIDRPLSHLTNSHSKEVNDWVDSLKSIFVFPKIIILEETDDINNLIELEIKHIDYQCKINPNILNKQHYSEYIKLKDVYVDLIKDLEDIGSVIKNNRILHNISQTDLANKTGMSRSSISEIEKGRNASIKSVLSILKEFNKLTGKDNYINKHKERAGY